MFTRTSDPSYSFVLRVAALSAFMAGGSAAALALDGTPAPAHAPAPVASLPPAFSAKEMTPQQALRKAVDAYRAGDSQAALPALKYAADNGNALAQWKLGKMYADGDGVPHDDYKAYQYFSQIVESYDEETQRRDVSAVSHAFVAVGVYSLKGIANSRVKRDPARALDMFQFAATHFGDANAQYNLARMYLDGEGVRKNPNQAVRWLNLAAEKSHTQAQGLLGHLLFAGPGGVARQRARGLMWLTLAREGADDAKDKWIVEAYDAALSAAGQPDRDAARVYLEAHLKKRD